MEFQGEGSDAQWGDLLGAAGTNQFPGDLLMQIVLRLPVKSILCFKSVCRAWCFLFNHPVFIQHHFCITSCFAKMNITLFNFKCEEGIQGTETLFTLLLNDLCDEPVIKYYDLFEVDYLALIGSINGLVCLTVNVMGKGESIMFWNPAIRKHTLIPNPRSLPGNDGNVLSGLAYDRKTDIYKVVRVVYSSAAGVAPSRVEIYSTGTNIWRTTEIIGFPGNMFWDRSGVVARGDLYWFTRGSQRSNLQELIVSFDATSEALTFHPIPLDGKPYSFDWVDLQSWSFEATGNHPVLMYIKYKYDTYEPCIERVTIRKLIKSDDGGRDLFHIENLTVEPLSGLELSRIIYMFGNGKIIAEDLDGNLIMYD